MAISDSVQTLTAAFSFGILLQAASGALLIYFKGHGSTIFQDGRRLVLVLFLFFTALWAQIDFLNLMIPSKSSTACQATLVFSTASDQLARGAIEQFLLWSVAQGSKVTAERLILQAILTIRVVAGGLLVGFTRPEFAPVCVARTSLLPISIVVLALDFIIIGVLIIRALSFGMFRALREARSTTHQEQSRALILSLAGFLVWTGASVVMLLGIPTTFIILRTTLPSTGLFLLVGIIAIFSNALLLPREEELTTPEARSPFAAPLPPSREVFRDIAGDGSPISGHNYAKNGSLFVVNPSATPRDSPTATYQANNQTDTRGFTKLGGEPMVRALETNEIDQEESKNGPGYRGSSGVFPTIMAASIINGALPPQIRIANDMVQNLPVAGNVPAPTSAAQKRSLFNWSKPPPQTSVRSLGISQPVMDNSLDPSAQSFARIPTIDLATAAINERERREGAAARSKLAANRPARPAIAPQDALRKSVSVKRKETPNRARETMPSVPSSAATGLSLGVANGSTTSASLSPGREEVRRRSPKNANSFDQLLVEKARSDPTLQRKQTLGLPSNPRATRIQMTQDAGMAKEQTVMFMNDIIYDHPGIVKTIINGAPDMYATAKRPNTSEKSPTGPYSMTVKSSGSIIHRPRPYRRDSDKDRAIFPSEPSPRHRRSKSGPIAAPRKSILMSQPGSPTKLPPLPAPPTSASKLTRLLPNNTRSMTFDEKIQLLFPAPPGSTLARHRRSSVPSLPRVPSVFIADTPPSQSPTEEEQQSRRASKRTTIASFGLRDNQMLPMVKIDDTTEIPEPQIFRYSANTYRTLADDVGETWIPGIPSKESHLPVADNQYPKRESLTYDMRKSAFTDATSSDASSHDDSTTYWGSIHSKIPTIDLSKATRFGKPTSVQQGTRLEPSAGVQRLSTTRESDYNDGEEIMTVMLEPEASQFSQVPDGNRQSFFLDADQFLPGDATPTPLGGPAWHRRIGDELPTFSERKTNTRSRKMPPPAPLLLNSKGRNATVVVRAAEPSPMDSPERAIKEIQAQLKRFEEPSRGSMGSILRNMPDGTSTTGEVENDRGGRFRLLENLEKEMGQQENQWQKMQTNLDRDSMSEILTPQPPASIDLSRESSQKSSRIPSRVVSRRARVRSSMTLRSKGEDSTSTTSTQSSDNSRASVWQQRLAEAQMEYLENAPTLLRKGSVNFLSISKAQLGSPTPPDSVGSESDLEAESDLRIDEGSNTEQIINAKPNSPLALWQPVSPSPRAAAGRMWNPPYESSVPIISSEPPAKNVRPAQRSIWCPLPIFSSELWSKPQSSVNSRPVVGLWGSRQVRPKSIVTRRVTQKPQRRSKRVTFLPDIVESPQPLPNKRDTLGIFQFPWGETSDSAVYQPVFDPTLLAGPIIQAKLDARSRELEPEPTEYSSSFFDDYDDEADEDLESDDDFDETTLWEIASLLKSEDVPSKNSLLPPARKVIEDYDDDETDYESESEERQDRQQDISAKPARQFSKLPIQPLATIPKGVPPLWTSDLPIAMPAITIGLPQPESQVWQKYIPEVTQPTRSKAPVANLPVLVTHDLWTSLKSTVPEEVVSPMWTAPTMARKTSDLISTNPIVQSPLMWVSQEAKVEPVITGLFSTDTWRSVFRSTEASPAALKMVRAPRLSTAGSMSLSSKTLWTPQTGIKRMNEWLLMSTVSTQSLMWDAAAPVQKTLDTTGLFVNSTERSDYRRCDLLPAAINMIRGPRSNTASLARLTSSQLWDGREELQIEHHWISESSTRPESPSFSEISSGRSSPASDTSSVKSTSTKASTSWGSITSFTIPKSAKKPVTSSPVDDGKFVSKVAVRQPPTKALAPLRESRALASRDLWEAMAPKLDKSPVKRHPEPANPPIRHQFRLSKAYSDNWSEELDGAINVGKPKMALKHTHPTFSMADWDLALAEAIKLGRPRLQRPANSPKAWKKALDEAITKGVVSKKVVYDVFTLHPVFFTESLTSNAVDIHPACLGHVTRILSYDVATRHPVVFTENLVSDIDDVHPAGLGYFSGPGSGHTHSSLWTTPTAITVSCNELEPMWSKAAVTKAEKPSALAKLSRETLRRATAPRYAHLLPLESTTIWQPAERVLSDRHLLSSTTVALPQTWKAPVMEYKDIPYGKLWLAENKGSPDQFSHVKAEHIQKKALSRPVALPRLSSTTLFEHKSSAVQETHWLHATTIESSGVASDYTEDQERSYTWASPSVSIEGQKHGAMWESRPAAVLTSSTLFSNPHTESWNRKKRETTSVKEIESTGMWKRSTAMPLSPTNWLLKKGISRVEFRY